MDIVTLAVAKNAAKKYTDSAIEGIGKGLTYKGAVDYYSDLPNNANLGDCYSVLYQGSSGTTPSGAEYVWGKKVSSGNPEWIKLGEDNAVSEILTADISEAATLETLTYLINNLYAAVYVTEDTYPEAYASLYSVFHSPNFGKVNTNIYMNSAAFNNLTLPAEANGETPGVMDAAISGFTTFGSSNIFAIQINEGIDAGTQKNTFYIYLQLHAMNNFEQTSNKVTSLSNASTDSQYPSAKCVYDLVGNINSLLGGI